MRVLLTGSRDWVDWDVIRRVLTNLKEEYGNFLLIHGGAKGADRIGDRIADDLGITRVSCPANWVAHGRSAGAIRNQFMIDTFKPDLVIAFPLGGPGTKDCIAKAEWANIKVKVYD